MGTWFYWAVNRYGWVRAAGVDTWGGLFFAAVCNTLFWVAIRAAILGVAYWFGRGWVTGG